MLIESGNVVNSCFSGHILPPYIPLSITLQVVKKAGPGTDVSVSDSWPASGTKRSVRDRLGNSPDTDLFYGSQLNNKRYVVLSFCFLSAAVS